MPIISVPGVTVDSQSDRWIATNGQGTWVIGKYAIQAPGTNAYAGPGYVARFIAPNQIAAIDEWLIPPWEVYTFEALSRENVLLGADDGNGGFGGGMGMFGAHVYRGGVGAPEGMYTVSNRRIRGGTGLPLAGAPYSFPTTPPNSTWKAPLAGVTQIDSHYEQIPNPNTIEFGLRLLFGDQYGSFFYAWFQHSFNATTKWGTITIIGNPTGGGTVYIKEPKVVSNFWNWNSVAVVDNNFIGLSGTYTEPNLIRYLGNTYTPGAGPTDLRSALGNPSRSAFELGGVAGVTRYLQAYGATGYAWSDTGFHNWYTVGDSKNLGRPAADPLCAQGLGGDLGAAWTDPLRSSAISSSLSGGISATSTSITLASTTGFPSRGKVRIEGETLYYDGVSGNRLTLSTTALRGREGSTAASHADQTAVTSLYGGISGSGILKGGWEFGKYRDLHNFSCAFHAWRDGRNPTMDWIDHYVPIAAGETYALNVSLLG